MDDYIVSNLLVFARLLRFAGLNVSGEQVADLARVLAQIGLTRREDVHNAARVVLVRRHEDAAIFERAFDLFFNLHGRPPRSVVDPAQAPSARVLRPQNVRQLAEQVRRARPAGESDAESAGSKSERTYSPIEVLRRKDFAEFTPEEIRAAGRLIAQMNWTVGTRRTRRKHSVLHGTALDFTRVARANLAHGGELFQLPEQENKRKPRPLVVLTDISGSMERSTRMLLELFHTLSHTRVKVETFVFATHLTRITPDLRKRSVQAALSGVGQRVTDWSGGTRIGEALRTFNWQWGRRVLRSGAVVLILSDGWDRGDLELLRDEMARLQRSCYRLIWLAPQPVAAGSLDSIALGLQVALPFVDDLMPVRNLDDLQALALDLARVGAARSLRRQQPHVAVPRPAGEPVHSFMELPQMGTSDYVRRTMTFRAGSGDAGLRYEENPGDP